jgi:OFA family oxalate/formate antiporter-like MFS transporter
VYPLLFLAYGVAGIAGPPTGGLLYDLTHSHVAAITTSVMVVLVGACWTWRASVSVTQHRRH